MPPKSDLNVGSRLGSPLVRIADQTSLTESGNGIVRLSDSVRLRGLMFTTGPLTTSHSCESCLGENPYVRMVSLCWQAGRRTCQTDGHLPKSKQEYGKECKVR